MEAMNGGATAAAADAAAKYLLDKPLHQLTEDDISQLTREDCRRYLKQKGMRRPSWNKSQAIQQVISLKSLLEPSPPKPPAFRVPTTTTTVTSNSSSSVKELSPADNDGSVSGLGEDRGPNQLPGPSGSDGAGREAECRPPSSDGKAIYVSCRRTDAPHLPNGQMTIFYSGKVNVYNGVPVDKARAIMHLAANPNQFGEDEPNNGNSTHWSTSCQLPNSNVKFNLATQDVTAMQSLITGKISEPVLQCRSDGNMLHEQDLEGQTNRQVSLKRYFEKRKDRGKFKVKKKIGPSSSGLEVYLNHQMRVPGINGQLTQCDTSSSGQIGIPRTVNGVMDKQMKNPGLSVDLNDKAS